MSLFQKAMKSLRREMKKSSLAALLVRVAGHLVGIPGLVAGLVASLVASLVADLVVGSATEVTTVASLVASLVAVLVAIDANNGVQ